MFQIPLKMFNDHNSKISKKLNSGKTKYKSFAKVLRFFSSKYLWFSVGNGSYKTI